MPLIRRIVIAGTMTAAALVLSAAPAAYADSASGADFGQHVRTCAQMMCFNDNHNPGTHQGYAGWDGMGCPM